MVDYMISAQAEVLYEKAHSVLAKYARYTDYGNKKNYPQCIDSMELDIVALAKKIILCETQEEIDNAKTSLFIYENIIDNIEVLSTMAAKL